MPKPAIIPGDEELRELFALFSSPTEYERKQIYERNGPHFYQNEDLSQEYTLTQEKREFAEDAWRAVAYFLFNNGFKLVKNDMEYDLLTSSGYDQD